MVRYKYFVSYNSSDKVAMGFGNIFITLDMQIEDEEHIHHVRDKIKEFLLKERKVSQQTDIVIINYILMKIVSEIKNG